MIVQDCYNNTRGEQALMWISTCATVFNQKLTLAPLVWRYCTHSSSSAMLHHTKRIIGSCGLNRSKNDQRNESQQFPSVNGYHFRCLEIKAVH